MAALTGSEAEESGQALVAGGAADAGPAPAPAVPLVAVGAAVRRADGVATARHASAVGRSAPVAHLGCDKKETHTALSSLLPTGWRPPPHTYSPFEPGGDRVQTEQEKRKRVR